MSTKATHNLTDRDIELLVAAFQCVKTPIAIDYQAYADKVGLKNSASATTAWHGLRKKLEKAAGQGKMVPEVVSGQEKTTPGKKRKNADADDNDDAEDEGASPKKTDVKPKRGRKAKADVKVEEDTVDDA